MNTQIQLKLSLSMQLNELLQVKAARFGVPITQFVKHLIIKEVSNDVYPVFEASDWTQKRVQKAIKEKNQATTIDAKDLHDFFENL